MSFRPVHALHTVPGKKPAIRATDVANAILFLASDEASMINGVSLPIDQAWSTI
jgi:NAD(P)-dependent dehydrogenase (short-subunit alcohol dehydrogenase family)